MKASQIVRPMLALTLLCGAALLAQAQDAAPAKAPATDAAKPAADTKAAPSLMSDAGWKLTLEPFGQYYWVSGNKSLFREQFQSQDKLNGGMRLQFTAINEDGITLDVDAKGAEKSNEHDVKVALSGPHDDWYIKSGSDNYHKYYSDHGGYWEGAQPTSYSLNMPLALDIGKFWVEAGVKTPDWPVLDKLSLRYEHSYRNGDESTEEWAAAPNLSGMNIYPAIRNIDEATDKIELTLSGKVAEIKWEDKLSYMWFNSYTNRNDFGTAASNVTPTYSRLVEEDTNYHETSNTFSVERWVTPKLLLSGGYMVLDHDGTSYDEVKYSPQVPITSGGRGNSHWWTNSVSLKQISHVGNLNAAIGPYGPFTLTLGLQAETSKTDSYAGEEQDSIVLTQTNVGSKKSPYYIYSVTTTPTMYVDDTLQKRQDTAESAELTFNAIPKTKLYVRGVFDQTDYQLEEYILSNAAQNLYHIADERRDDVRLRTGFTTNIVPRLTIGSYVEHREVRDNFNFEADQGKVNVPQPGYSAFILANHTTTDSFALRLSSPVTNWLFLDASYQYVTAGMWTIVSPTAVAAGLPYSSPTNESQSNQYDSQTYNLSATVLPCNEVSITGFGSFNQTRSRTPDIGFASIDRYYAETTTLGTSLTCHVTKTTDITGSYAFARSNSSEDYVPNVVSRGVDYVSNTFTLGVKHKFTEKMTGGIQGLYSSYIEDHLADGSYHVLGLSANLKWTF